MPYIQQKFFILENLKLKYSPFQIFGPFKGGGWEIKEGVETSKLK